MHALTFMDHYSIQYRYLMPRARFDVGQSIIRAELIMIGKGNSKPTCLIPVGMYGVLLQ